MKIYDLISTCLRNLLRRKTRTILTTIGVVVGCCAIVLMLSLGIALNKSMNDSISQWADLNTITVYGNRGGGGIVYASSSKTVSSSSSGGQTEAPKLNDEALATLGAIKGVDVVYPLLQADYNTFTLYGGRGKRYAVEGQIVGMDLSQLAEKHTAQFGSLEGLDDPANLRGICVVGSEVPYQFRDLKRTRNNMIDKWQAQANGGELPDPFVDMIEDYMLLTVNNTTKDRNDKTWMYPSGGRAYEHKISAAAILEENWGGSLDPYSIAIDINWMKELLESYNRLTRAKDTEIQYSQLLVHVPNLDDMADIQAQITALGYNASSMEDYRQQVQGQLNAIQLFLGGLAAISLFVAALGITNTMVMSIYERTREIGVMKVLGCFVGNVRAIFLMEAGCIGFLGGFVGVALSFILSAIANNIPALVSALDFAGSGAGKISIIPPWLVLAAFAFSTLIGLIAGFGPSNRAVKISALEAIKQD